MALNPAHYKDQRMVPSPRYGDPYYKDKPVMRLSSFYNRNSYSGDMSSLYLNDIKVAFWYRYVI